MNQLFEMTFFGTRDYEAYDAACKWCAEHGYSVGALQAGAPTAVFHGDCEIAKWRNLSKADLDDSAGRLEAPGRTYRTGPVRLILKKEGKK